MIDWKGSFQLFANVVGMMGLGAMAGLAEAWALWGSFRIDDGYLPLLVALTAGAIAVGVRIGIGGLRRPAVHMTRREIIFLIVVLALCILVSGLPPLALFMRDTPAYGVLTWFNAALLVLAFSSLVWMFRKGWAESRRARREDQ